MKRSGISGLLSGFLILAGLFFAGYYWLRTSANPYWNEPGESLYFDRFR